MNFGTSVVSTLIGTGIASSTNNIATLATINNAVDVFENSNGDIYFVDNGGEVDISREHSHASQWGIFDNNSDK